MQAGRVAGLSITAQGQQHRFYFNTTSNCHEWFQVLQRSSLLYWAERANYTSVRLRNMHERMQASKRALRLEVCFHCTQLSSPSLGLFLKLAQ